MKNLRFSRRNLMRGAGLGMATHMLLPELTNPAYAAEAVPKNFILIYSYHGTWKSDWGSATGGLTLGPLLEPLAAFKNDMVLVSGMKMRSAEIHKPSDNNSGHIQGQVHSLTSMKPASAVFEGARPNAGGPSIDQAILQLLKAKNGGQQLTPVDSLQLAIMDTAFEGQMMGRAGYAETSPGKIKALSPLQDPNIAWYQLFNGFDPGAAMTPADPGKPDPRLIKRKLMAEFANGQFQSTAQKIRDLYGKESQDRFDAHATYMSSLEKSLAPISGDGGGGGGVIMPSASCSVPSRDTVPKKPSSAGGWVDVLSDNMPKLAHLALACGRTRFVTLNIEESVTADPGIHDKVHGNDRTGTRSYHLKIATEIARLFKMLKDTPTADGKNLLHHSVVLWAGELGDGWQHSWNDVNWVVAGQAGGALQTGRFVNTNGRSTADLFVSLGKLMDSGMTTFGDPAAFNGPLNDIKA